MINKLKKGWRSLHINDEFINLSARYALSKKQFKLVDRYDYIPNLILIGSQKCGTTSLYNYLNAHPDIYMSEPIKESGFFIFDEWAKSYWKEKGLKIRSKKELVQKHMITEDFFGQKYFGDASTYYTQDNRVFDFDIPRKIKNESPNAKLLYLIRNPFARIVSTYYHMKKFWDYTHSLDHFIESSQSAINTSLYNDQIKPYWRIFNNNLKIIQFEDLITQPSQIMGDIFDFLELDANVQIEFKVHNRTSPNNSQKFSKKNFENLYPIFIDQQELLRSEYQLNLDWDLKENTWTQ